MKNKEDDLNFTYFIEDVLKCFPSKFEGKFVHMISDHYVVKEKIYSLFLLETEKKKPNYNILSGGLIVINSYLRKSSRGAIYEISKIISGISYCYSQKKWKTIKQNSAKVILRLFGILYREYIIIPIRKEEGQEYLNNFVKYFSAKDMINICNTQGVFVEFILERECGIKVGVGTEERNKRINEIISNFFIE